MANTDKVEGKLKEVGGDIQQGLGDLTGDNELKARGAANKTEGKAQGLFGKIKDTVAGIFNGIFGKNKNTNNY